MKLTNYSCNWFLKHINFRFKKSETTLTKTHQWLAISIVLILLSADMEGAESRIGEISVVNPTVVEHVVNPSSTKSIESPIDALKIEATANMAYWNVKACSWSLSGSSPFTPGQSMGVNFSISAQRNASHSIPIDIYVSWDAAGNYETYITTTYRYIQQPGSFCSSTSTTNFTLPLTPPGPPSSSCYKSVNYYVLLKHNGTILKALSFTADQPSISSLSHSSGYVGSQITINGSDFDHINTVKFYSTPSSRVSATIVSSSSSHITVTVPSGASTGTIQLTGCQTAYTSSFTVLVGNFTSFSPKAGIPNAPFTLKGSGLSGATAVKFQGTSANYVIIDDSTIKAYMPASAPAKGTITVEAGKTLTSTDSFERTSCTPFAYADFEDELPTWQTYNGDNNTTFTVLSGLGGFGASSTCIGILNYNYNAPGELDGIITPNLCLSNIDSLSLSFDVAYAPYSTSVFETLYVYYSLNGGSFSLLWSKGGNNLATAAAQTSFFVPTGSQWRTETINLSNLIGSNTSIQILIVQANAYGNNLFIDNIRLNTYPIVWTSLSDVDWNTADGWSSGTIPSGNDTVMISKSAVVPTLNVNASIAKLIFDGGSELNLGSNKTLSVNGDINGSEASITGSGKISLNGSASQTAMIDSISNLEINNTSHVTLGSDLKVSRNIDFQAGVLKLGDFDLTIANNGTITGYDEDEYVATTGAGSLIRQVSSGNTVFPIGTASSFNPTTLSNSGTPDSFSLRVTNGVLDNGMTGTSITSNVVGNTWFIQEKKPGNSNVSATFQWNTSDELTGFNRNQCGIGHYSGGTWIKQAKGAAVSGSVSNSWQRTITGLTTFSPFGVGDGSSLLPVEITHFSGRRVSATQVVLNWSTASEMNNAGFQIERAFKDEADFHSIGFVDGHGITQIDHDYEFTDWNAQNELTYYRLKQIDYNGNFEYLKTISVSAMGEEDISDLFRISKSGPNNLQIVFDHDVPILFEVFDSSRRMLFRESSKTGAMNLDTAGWPHGIYFIRGTHPRGIQKTKKISIP